MTFIVGLLTVALVLNSLLLILLVLIQLPKKDAGAGLAFGGAATDALFGAGSGNVLTKITKYATIVFFVLAIAVGVLQSTLHKGPVSEVERQLNQPQSSQPGAMPAPSSMPEVPPATAGALTNPVAAPPAAVPSTAAAASTNPASTTTPVTPVPVTAPTNPAPAAPPK
jgi:preprotein translocase subunit SecG